MTRGSKLAAILLAATAFQSHYTLAQPNSVTKLQQVQALIVFDANRKKVGEVLGFHLDRNNPLVSRPVVGLSNGDRSVALAVRGDLFVVGPGGFDEILLFQTTDCTGTPFTPNIDALLDNAAQSYTFVHNDQIVYVPDGEVVHVSALSNGTGPTNCSLGGGEFQGIALRFLIDLKGHFVPPFSVRRTADKD